VHVLQLSTFHERCGIATYTEGLARALEADRTRVTILSPHLQEADPGHGSQPPRLWSRNRATAAEAKAVARRIQELRPDLVHVQFNSGLFSASFLAVLANCLARAGIGMVATLHARRPESVSGRLKLARVLFAFRHARLVVHNRAHADELRPRDVHVIPHGIAETRDSFPPRAPVHRDPQSPLLLVHFGFLFPDKGIHEVIAAIAELHKKGVARFRYIVCGAVYSSDESKQYHRYLVDLVRRTGLEDHVRIAGEFLDEARTLVEIGMADWVLLNYGTGSAQGTSGAVRHALATCRPVAVSRAPIFDDIREAVHTLRAPLPEALIELAANPALATQTTERARHFCRTHTWRRVAERHIELYEMVRRATGSRE
jgi:glycosyltransferase involved in cell wall biosynthesis